MGKIYNCLHGGAPSVSIEEHNNVLRVPCQGIVKLVSFTTEANEFQLTFVQVSISFYTVSAFCNSSVYGDESLNQLLSSIIGSWMLSMALSLLISGAWS